MSQQDKNDAWDELTGEQQLVTLSERKLGKNQVELGVYLMAELDKDAADVVAILDAIREFNAAKRGAGAEGETKRVSVAEKIVQSLLTLKDNQSNPDYQWGVEDSISTAGRFV